MNERERNAMIDQLDERSAEIIADHARRQARPATEPRIAPAPRAVPAPAAPRPPAPPAPRSNPGMTRRDIETMMNAVGNAIGTVRAELRKAHRAELDALEKRIEHLERSRKGAKILDARGIFGKEKVA